MDAVMATALALIIVSDLLIWQRRASRLAGAATLVVSLTWLVAFSGWLMPPPFRLEVPLLIGVALGAGAMVTTLLLLCTPRSRLSARRS